METAAPAPQVKKPRVIGIVGISILSALFTILGVVGLLAVLNDPSSAGFFPAWLTILAYALLVIAICQIIGAVLVLLYRKIGLYITGLLYVVGLIITAVEIVTGYGSLNLVTIISILLNLAILYYVYRYLTHEPEKSFFK